MANKVSKCLSLLFPFFLFLLFLLASTREKLLKARQGVKWKLHTHTATHTHANTRQAGRQTGKWRHTAAPRLTHAAYAQYPGQTRQTATSASASAYANAFVARAKRRTKRFDNLQTGRERHRGRERKTGRQAGRQREGKETKRQQASRAQATLLGAAVAITICQVACA